MGVKCPSKCMGTAAFRLLCYYLCQLPLNTGGLSPYLKGASDLFSYSKLFWLYFSDVDPCIVNTCKVNENCIPLMNNFKCECKDGFEKVKGECSGECFFVFMGYA